MTTDSHSTDSDKRGKARASFFVLALLAGALISIAWWFLATSKRADQFQGVRAEQRATHAAQGDPGTPPGTALADDRQRIAGWVDEPAGDTLVGPTIELSGWALAKAGVRAVEVRVNGRAFVAEIGLPRPDVAQEKANFIDRATAGFRFRGDVSEALTSTRFERVVAEVVAVDKQGAEQTLARKHIVPRLIESEWKALFPTAKAEDKFYIVPGLSAVGLGSARDLDSAYKHYESETFRIGMRVPILYMRTTKGAKGDWQFDPDWDYERKCGERRIAEDSLNRVIAHAVATGIPVLFTLNGGVWADASCGVPEWDAGDHLEEDEANCQWNQDNQVYRDDHLKNLPGAQSSPELARMLTYNVFAERNRHYKRRNLQAAGKLIADFARQHPDLFIGINLDPDTVHNPFFEQQQWYDFNPNTLKQFRHWLAGTGPYAGTQSGAGPDLRSYRRPKTLTLKEVNDLSNRAFRSWAEVEPPRAFPLEGSRKFWEDPWAHEWEVFRRHLIDLHYDELSRWLVEVGIPKTRIYSAQGFMAPHASAMPFAVRVTSPTKNYDSGGVSIEGAVPSHGHLGAVLYGPAVRNDIRMEGPGSLFSTFKRLDPDWAVIEFNTADLRTPDELPTYAMAYKAFRDAFNYGARFMSPMAWGGSDGTNAGKPGYVSYMAWRNTPLEAAMRDFAVQRAHLPRGSKLWTFGSANHVSDDGWAFEKAGDVTLKPGYVTFSPQQGPVTLVSPPDLAMRTEEFASIVIGIDSKHEVASAEIEFRDVGGRSTQRAVPAEQFEFTAAGLRLPARDPSGKTEVDQIRVSLRFKAPGVPVTVRHVAILSGTASN